jgi:hypothetical protein
MIRVEWRTEVSFDDVFRKVLEQNLESVRRELEGIRCPIHGEPPKIVVTGTDATSISAKVEGCCEELGRLTKAKTAELGFEEE